jgi:hypothetical protein
MIRAQSLRVTNHFVSQVFWALKNWVNGTRRGSS